ncbi:hypothetical protein H5410_057529, partial [Solanum commersonii]
MKLDWYLTSSHDNEKCVETCRLTNRGSSWRIAEMVGDPAIVHRLVLHIHKRSCKTWRNKQPFSAWPSRSVNNINVAEWTRTG